MTSKYLIPALIGSAVLASSANAALVLFDDFNSTNYVDGQNIEGTTGVADTGSYQADWVADDAGGFGRWDGDGLAYSGTPTTAGSLTIIRPSGSFANGYYGARVDADGNAAGGNVLYWSAKVSFNTDLSNLNNGFRFGMDLSSDNGSIGRYSEIGFTNAGEAAIWNNGGQDDSFSETSTPNATDNSGTYTANTTYFLVGKVEDLDSSTDDIVSMWVNPTLGGSETTALVSANVGFGGLNVTNSNITWLQFQAGVNNAGETVSFDDIRIGTTWDDVVPVPEPSAFALLAGCLALGSVMLRRRSN